MAGHALPDKAIREQIASALEVVIHVSRMSDGSRKVLSVEEIVGMEGSVVTMQEIFRFTRTGIGPGGKILGRYEATGVVPHFSDRVEQAGTDLAGIFARTALR
jgi:pilus assembly protein CpaF